MQLTSALLQDITVLHLHITFAQVCSIICLDAIAFSLRGAQHTSTGQTPYKMMFGWQIMASLSSSWADMIGRVKMINYFHSLLKKNYCLHEKELIADE